MPAMLDDFSVHKRGDLSYGIVRGAVKFESFGGSGVIFDHLIESFADIDSLEESSI